MDAPNKLYADVSYNGMIGRSSAVRQAESDVEYIRKDAIIKYLDEHFSSLMEPETQEFINELSNFIESL